MRFSNSASSKAAAAAIADGMPAFVANGLAAQAAADAVIERVTKERQAQPPVQSFKPVPIADIFESKLNPRKTFKQASLEELAESIRQSGVWTPITVRPVGILFEIAAGHRRFRAAQMAGLTEIPAIVREMTDQQFAELVTFENLGREDVHPLEEADGFQLLIRNYQYTVVQIAEKIGCHESYVHKRLRLARLIEPARKSFLAEEISLQHAIHIARLEPEQQKQAFGMCLREDYDRVLRKSIKSAIPAVSLDARIRSEILLDLSSAPWKKDDDMLLPKAGACTGCSKRTGAHAKLFDDFQKGDHCLDKGCFEAKRVAFVDVKIAELTHKNRAEPVRVATTWADNNMLKKLGAVQDHSFRLLTKKDRCESAEAAIVVYGNDVGRVMQICRDSKCSKHRGFSSYQLSPQEIAAERRRKTEAKVDAAYRAELWKRTWTVLRRASREGLRPAHVETLAHYLIERIGHDARGPLVKLLELKDLSKPKASTVYEDTNTKLLRAYFAGNLTPEERVMFLVALATAPATGSMFGGALKTLEETSKGLGLDCAAVRKEIAAPILAKEKAVAEREKAKAAADKKAGKKAAPAAETKRAAANDVDDEDDYIEEFDGSEELSDE